MLTFSRRSFLQVAAVAGISALPSRPGGLRLSGAVDDASGPLRLDVSNYRYCYFRGKPMILLGSGEHYGSVMNTAFDYSLYVETIAKAGLNHTRLFSGVYHEVPGDFGIVKNTLGPEPKDFLCPWVRSTTTGAVDGLNKFDLSRWNEKYFERLSDFMDTTSHHNIVVEMNLFCPFYHDRMWNVSPLNARNNINGIGDMKRTEVYTLRDDRMQALQDELVRRISATLREFDNFYFEICNEAYFGGVTLDWQKHIAKLIVDTEGPLPKHHLISQNIANGSEKILDPDPLVSIFNFHYSRPPYSVDMNYAVNKAIGNNETGHDGASDGPYRIEAWDFLTAGGALFSNLDYSFAVGYEDGTFFDTTPGGGGRSLRYQYKLLLDFMNGYDFVRMAPSPQTVKSVAPSGASIRVLADPGKAYAIYLHHGRPSKGVKVGTVGYSLDSAPYQEELVLELPENSYISEWMNTKTGGIDKSERFTHAGGRRTFAAPQYTEDIALRIKARESA
jgi:hypothetical protein